MIKIFYNNKKLFLCDASNETNMPAKIVFSDEEDMKKIINSFLDEAENSIKVLCRAEVGHFLEKFKHHFEYVEAAGGLVLNLENKLLFIFKRNTWDLPKGKKDKGEDVQKTAIREVSEECGLDLSDLEIVNYIDSTYHIYLENEKAFLKRTSWFFIRYIGTKPPVAEEKEGISIVRWIDSDEIQNVLKNTYPSVVEILEKADFVII